MHHCTLKQALVVVEEVEEAVVVAITAALAIPIEIQVVEVLINIFLG